MCTMAAHGSKKTREKQKIPVPIHIGNIALISRVFANNSFIGMFFHKCQAYKKLRASISQSFD